jgi:hypothetical protein
VVVALFEKMFRYLLGGSTDTTESVILDIWASCRDFNLPGGKVRPAGA